MIKRQAATMIAILAFGLAASAAPEIQVDADTYDFGTIVEGFAVEHTFVLSNVGDETLVITRVYAGCGCTTTALETTELPPGESVDLHAIVSTNGFGGSKISKPIYVYSNDPRFAGGGGPDRLVLYIAGSVLRAEAYHTTIEDVRLYSPALIDLRPADAYEAGHFIGALNVQPEALLDALAALPKDNVIVLYDATGALADANVEELIGAGYPFACVLSGGLANWTRAFGTLYLFPEPIDPDYGDPAPTRAGWSLDPTQLAHAVYILVDLRTPEEYAAGHLVGATNIPIDVLDVDDLAHWLGDLPYDAEIVVYDQHGTESDAVAQALIAAGYTDTKSLLGGLDEWEHIYGDQLIWAETP